MLKPNTYIHRISKDLLQWMPLAAFEGEVIVVDKPEMVSEAVAYLRTQRVLGVDTEARPSFNRGVHYPTALVQISSKERCYLFRLTHVGMPKELADIFADASICKVGLAFKDDINGLRRRRNFTPANCVDLQAMVGRYGILDLGLQKIFAILFGQRISKNQQLSNWEIESLTEGQRQYAAIDAWACLMIYLRLKELQASGDYRIIRDETEESNTETR